MNSSRMTQSRVPGQPDLMVIEEDGVSSRYNQRMTGQELEDSKSLLLRLNEEEASREVMIKEISQLLGRAISRSQVDKLRKDLGLVGRQNKILVPPPLEVTPPTEPSEAVQDPFRSWAAMTASGSLQQEHFASSVVDVEDVGSTVQVFVDGFGYIADSEGSYQTSDPTATDPLTLAQPQEQYLVDDVLLGISSGQPSTSQEDGDTPVSAAIQSDQVTSSRQSPISPSWQLQGLPYSPSTRAHKLYTSCSRDLESKRDGIARLNHAATILHILRAFDQAFDLYFLIFCHFRDLETEGQPPHPQFVCAAVNCARSARTISHVMVAETAVSRARKDLLAYYGSGLLDRTRIGLFLEQLKHQLCALKPSALLLGHAPSGFQEGIEDTAYWEANAIILGLHELAIKPAALPDYFMTSWQGSVVQHLHKCDVTRSAMVEGLAEMSEIIKRYRHRIDKMEHRYSDTHIAQVISGLLLYNRLRPSAIPLSSFWTHHHAQFPCHWNGYAALTLPFVLVNWLQRPEFASRHGPRLTSTNRFILAEDEIWRSFQSASRYKEFINLYLRLMSAPDHGSPELVLTVSGDWLFGMAAVTAKLDPGPDDWLLENNLLSQHDEMAVDESGNGDDRSQAEDAAADVSFPIGSTAPSSTSFGTSSYNSFRGLAIRLRESVSPSLYTQQTRSSGAMTSRSSWSFSRVTGFPQAFSRSRSIRSGSSDVAMSG